MQNFLKGKLATTVIILSTFVLAGIAIFTAVRLYQLRSQSVAPNVPSSKPRAAVVNPNCSMTLTLTLASTSPSPTATPINTLTQTSTPTPTPTATPTPGTPNSCGGTCGSNANCASNLVCYNGFCRNPSCTTSSSCVCATVSVAATPTPLPTATPIVATLPQSGTDWPTYVGAGFGIVVILASLLIAL